MIVYYRCEFNGARNVADFEIMHVILLLGPYKPGIRDFRVRDTKFFLNHTFW